jgi:hypothetical protein
MFLRVTIMLLIFYHGKRDFHFHKYRLGIKKFTVQAVSNLFVN